ncbi:MAG: hypothetical protein HGA46_01225 [Chlorobiaceae bacterium]|nr:hypothetical protein [Chlorobiaceae bacterium]
MPMHLQQQCRQNQRDNKQDISLIQHSFSRLAVPGSLTLPEANASGSNGR